MQICSGPAPVPAHLRGGAVAIGNFDGVHLGHQAVVAAAQAHPGPHGAAVFKPHPRQFFHPDAPPFRLQTSAQRARALAALGVDALFETPFTADLARLTDEAFVREVLIDWIGARHVTVGFDFRFGRDRMGDAESLQRLGERHGLSVDVIDAVDDGRHAGKVSSSGIREALQAGDPALAAAQLGRPFAIEGAVISGMQRARSIGFPTANVALGDYVRPRFGVYATRTDIGDGVWRAGVSNCGVKPTIGGVSEPLLETHIFDLSADLYGRTVETQLVSFLRPERKFESFEALTAQIAKDAKDARAAL